MISTKIFFSGVLLLMILFFIARLDIQGVIETKGHIRETILGLLVIISVTMIILGAFGMIWGI